jgi:hypothetical protein
MADPKQVLVTEGETAHAFQVHHRDIPELHADGETPVAAARNLAQDLTRELEGVVDNPRREPFERALADVRGFIEPRL